MEPWLTRLEDGDADGDADGNADGERLVLFDYAAWDCAKGNGAVGVGGDLGPGLVNCEAVGALSRFESLCSDSGVPLAARPPVPTGAHLSTGGRAASGPPDSNQDMH